MIAIELTEVGRGPRDVTGSLADPMQAIERRHAFLLALSIVGLIGIATAATFTGGAKSPLLPLLVVIIYVAGLLGRHPRLFIALVVVFFVGTFGAEVLLEGRWALPLPTYALGISTLFTSLAGTFVLGRVRRRLEARRSELEALHQQAVVAVTARHRELIEVAGALAHQLKNPLSAVHGLATLLERRAEDPELIELAREARALNTAVHELLDFSRPVSESALEKLTIGAVLERLAGARGAKVRLEGETGAEVLGEGRKLERVIDALITAAAQGGSEVAIRIAKGDDNVDLELSSAAPREVDTHELLVARLLAEQHGARIVLPLGDAFRANVSWPKARAVEAF